MEESDEEPEYNPCCKDGVPSNKRKLSTQALTRYVKRKSPTTKENTFSSTDITKIHRVEFNSKRETLELFTKTCRTCENTLTFEQFSNDISTSDGKESRCKACRKIYDKQRNRTLDRFLQRLHTNAKNRAKKRKGAAAEFSITPKDVYDLWEKQRGRCSYSNLPMSTKPNSDWQCSLERLDPSKGYIKTNIALIILELNTAAQWSREAVWSIAELVSKPITNREDLSRSSQKPKNRRTKKHRKVVPTKLSKEGTVYECCNCFVYKSQRDMTMCNSMCKDCLNHRHKLTIYDELKKLLGHAKANTGKRNDKIAEQKDHLKCTIKITDLQRIFEQQGGRCYYSGIPFEYGYFANPVFQMSLERKDSTRGYELDNVCLICFGFQSSDRSRVCVEGRLNGSAQWSRVKFATLAESARSSKPE